MENFLNIDIPTEDWDETIEDQIVLDAMNQAEIERDVMQEFNDSLTDY